MIVMRQPAIVGGTGLSEISRLRRIVVVVKIKCSACGNEVYMQKTIPIWAIVFAICLFPIGLLFLLIKKYKCPQCGNMI